MDEHQDSEISQGIKEVFSTNDWKKGLSLLMIVPCVFGNLVFEGNLIMYFSVLGLLGFLAFFFLSPKHWSIAIIPGLIGGPLVAIFGNIYLGLRGEEINRFEFVIPIALGILPSGLMYYAFLKKRIAKEVNQRHDRLKKALESFTQNPE